MKKWQQSFVETHGERIVFLAAAVLMALAFYATPDLRESGKTILIGAAMLLYNKARSPENTKGEKNHEPTDAEP